MRRALASLFTAGLLVACGGSGAPSSASPGEPGSRGGPDAGRDRANGVGGGAGSTNDASIGVGGSGPLARDGGGGGVDASAGGSAGKTGTGGSANTGGARADGGLLTDGGPAEGARASIGPTGGTLTITGGIALEVPPRALATTVMLVGRTVPLPTAMEGMGAEPVAVIELEPQGLGFQTPVTLHVEVRGDASPMVVGMEPGSGWLENVAFRTETDGSLDLTLWHFSTYVVFAPIAPGTRVTDVMACNTQPVAGLSKQIEQLFQRATGSLTPISDARIRSADPLGAPLVQTSVASDVLAGLADPAATSAAAPLEILSGWLSPAALYVLDHCNPGPTGLPAAVHAHADGSAIDVAGPLASAACAAALGSGTSAATALETAEPVWGALLESHGLDWYGMSGDPCADPTHFSTASAESASLKAAAIEAFQKLWTNNNPCDPLDETGDLDPDTLARLALSPASGFPAGADGIQIQGKAGVAGAGCPGDGEPGDTTCCADKECHDLNSEEKNCGQCGTACAPPLTCENGQCVCPTGQTQCGTVCVDLTSDSANCGSCQHPCNQPPPNACTSAADGVDHYAAQGTCSNSVCHYDTTTEACIGPAVCCDATCVDHTKDPTTCCGVVCNEPPPDSCSADGTAIVHHDSNGTCSIGSCSYAPTNEACPTNEHCAGGQCVGCGSGTCPDGCCDANGICQTGTSDAACGGGGGGACINCAHFCAPSEIDPGCTHPAALVCVNRACETCVPGSQRTTACSATVCGSQVSTCTANGSWGTPSPCGSGCGTTCCAPGTTCCESTCCAAGQTCTGYFENGQKGMRCE